MNDPHKNLKPGLVLVLHWPLDEDVSAAGQNVVIELQLAGGIPLASMSVPSVQLLQAVAQRLVLYSLMSPAGLLSIASDEITIPLPVNQAIALDQLITEAVSEDMLEDEPDAAAMLAEFRSRLLKSLEHVDRAIAALPKD